MANILFVRTGARSHLGAPLLVFAIISCAGYSPISVSQSVPGYDVRVSLSDQGAVDVAPRIGQRARQLEGRLKQVSDTSLLLSVHRVVREGGGDDTYSDLEVDLPSRDIDTVERSSTSMSRSFLAAGAIVATALLAAKGAGNVSGGGSGGHGGNGK
jgi:hypothetical protein